MAATDQILSRLRRTMQTIFGVGNVQIKDSSGVVQLRDSTDSAFADAAVNKLRVQGGNATNAVVLNAPAALGSTVTFVLPSADGASNQVMATDGAGNLSFISTSAGGITLESEAFTEATSSPLTIFTAPANSEIVEVTVKITTAAGGGSPTVSVGVSGTVALYMATTDSDLKTTGEYTIYPLADVGGSNIPIILTITPSAQTFVGVVFVKYGTAA